MYPCSKIKAVVNTIPNTASMSGVAIAKPMFSKSPPTSLAVTEENLREQPDKRGNNAGFDGDFISVESAAIRRLDRSYVIPFLNQRAVSVITNGKRH